MRTVNWDEHLHIWIDKIPYSLPSLQVKTTARTYAALHPTTTLTQTIVAEAVVPLGGMTMYGLLGAVYATSAKAELVVKVDWLEELESVITGTRAPFYETVRAGLLREYIDGVFSGILDAEGPLKGGILYFNYAACGDIGSSSMIFRTLSAAIARVAQGT